MTTEKNKQITLFIIGFLFLGIAIFMVGSVNNFTHHAVLEQEEQILETITKAAVQCFALEGGYPPDLEYLVKHYGIVLDTTNYVYYYDAFASNIRPEIMVKSLLIDETETEETDFLDDTSIDLDGLKDLLGE